MELHISPVIVSDINSRKRNLDSKNDPSHSILILHIKKTKGREKVLTQKPFRRETPISLTKKPHHQLVTNGDNGHIMAQHFSSYFHRYGTQGDSNIYKHQHNEDIEYCGTGWLSALDGSAQCESGHCCSIHGKCGLEDYHCGYGLKPEWIIFTGIILMSICGFVYNCQVSLPKIIKLMEQYKRYGIRIDASVMPSNTRMKQKRRKKKSSWFGCIKSWYRYYQEGMRHCRWNQLAIEYNFKSSSTTLVKGELSKTQNEHRYRIQKTIYVSKFVLTNADIDDNDDDGSNRIRVLVLPGKPKSAFARDEVNLTIIKHQKQIQATYFAVLLFSGLYLYLSLLILSLVGGQSSKLLGWQYFISNFIWTPILPYVIGKIRDKREHRYWLYDGEYISTTGSTTSSGSNNRQTQQLLLQHIDENDGNED